MIIEELKLYTRCDDDLEVNAFKESAEVYLKNAGVKMDYNNPLYKLAVKMLVCNWYDNRGIDTGESLNKISYSLGIIITQLKLSGDVL